MPNQMHILLHATKKKRLTCFRQFQSFNVRNYNFDRNSRQASTFSINRALLVLFLVFSIFLTKLTKTFPRDSLTGISYFVPRISTD